MREYPIATNSPQDLTVPTLTVTVRSALFVPAGCLPPKDAGEHRGRETWVGAGSLHTVLATFEMSVRPIGEGPLELVPVGARARSVTRASGVACTDVRHSAELKPQGVERSLGEARLPLFGKKRGDYLLRIVPRAEQTTMTDAGPADGPVGPGTIVRGVDRAYRPLHVRLTFDDQLHLVDAVTCTVRDGVVHPTEDFTLPDERGGTRTVALPVNHGYVTAFAVDELAIDLKPDVVQSDILEQSTAPAAHRRTAPIDMVVLHATGEPIMGTSVNTARPMHYVKKKVGTDENGKAIYERVKDAAGNDIIDDDNTCGPHYEVDRDGHVVKFLPEDFVAWQAGPSHYYLAEEGSFITNVNGRGIGIELTHVPDSGYPDRQMVGLLGLLARLRDRYGIQPHRVIGHVECLTKGTTMDDDRIQCPSRDLDWPRLERAGFGRPMISKELGPADYCGYFALSPDLMALATGHSKPAPPKLQLGDKDGERKWGGINWSMGLAAIHPQVLHLVDVVRQVQRDLRLLGYSVDLDGSMNEKTDRALAHFVARVFSGPRRTGYLETMRPALRAGDVLSHAAAPERSPGDPSWVLHEDIPTNLGGAVVLTRLIASYLRGSAEAASRSR